MKGRISSLFAITRWYRGKWCKHNQGFLIVLKSWQVDIDIFYEFSFQPDTVRLPEEEERPSGTIDNQVFMGYIKAGVGIFSFVLLVLVFVMAQALYVIIDWWLARW